MPKSRSRCRTIQSGSFSLVSQSANDTSTATGSRSPRALLSSITSFRANTVLPAPGSPVITSRRGRTAR